MAASKKNPSRTTSTSQPAGNARQNRQSTARTSTPQTGRAAKPRKSK